MAQSRWCTALMCLPTLGIGLKWKHALVLSC